jgi:hypothetical protein
LRASDGAGFVMAGHEDEADGEDQVGGGFVEDDGFLLGEHADGGDEAAVGSELFDERSGHLKGGAQVTMMASKGAASGQPWDASAKREWMF